MRRIAIILCLSYLTVLMFAVVARASPKHWSHLTLAKKQALVSKKIKHERSTVRWWISHRPRADPALSHLTLPFQLKMPHCHAIGIRSPYGVCVHARSMRRALVVLTAIHKQMEVIQKKRLEQAAVLAWPAHHGLWLCIHNGEGAWNDQDSGHNGHYGGLQMTPGWYGGSGHLASSDSQLVQEQEAEQGYAASGYSRVWLMGQWGQTIGPCWGDAA